ncbi:NTF2 fold immunity protein [uncultured Chryseobacterium sp.]|uniref:NTF2 fold immunity protein n=1 Tax=uncultured Chryseobacterium sp. TaxID=259322 RepID=UPI00258895C1|nr:NTF2 fold immunity protein [uncultured Chryseobacterium sp.]
MKYYTFILLVSLSCCEQRISNKSEKNITDKEIAISVAEKKWKEVYGKSVINKQKPFVAQRKNDSIWTVHGNFPKPSVIGGVAYAEVNIKTKEVVKYTHGE